MTNIIVRHYCSHEESASDQMIAQRGDGRRPQIQLMSRTYPTGYTFVKELGTGLLGQVDVVRDVKANATVVIRALDARLVSVSDWPSRFRRTCQTIMSLDSPYLNPVMDFEVDGSKAFQVMAKAPGESLADYLKTSPKVPGSVVASILSQILDALHDLHSVVHHGCLSPKKVMVAKHGRELSIVLRDAGCGANDRDRLSLGLGEVSALRYLAPEQILLEPADHRADLFAVGVMGYELLSGQPLGPDKPFELFHARVNGTCAPLKLADGSEDPEFDTFLAIALQRQPRDRYESAEQMKLALAEIATGRGWKLPKRAAPAQDDAKPKSRLPLLVAGAGALAIAGAGIVYALQPPTPVPEPEPEPVVQIKKVPVQAIDAGPPDLGVSEPIKPDPKPDPVPKPDPPPPPKPPDAGIIVRLPASDEVPDF